MRMALRVKPHKVLLPSLAALLAALLATACATPEVKAPPAPPLSYLVLL